MILRVYSFFGGCLLHEKTSDFRGTESLEVLADRRRIDTFLEPWLPRSFQRPRFYMAEFWDLDLARDLFAERKSALMSNGLVPQIFRENCLKIFRDRKNMPSGKWMPIAEQTWGANLHWQSANQANLCPKTRANSAIPPITVIIIKIILYIYRYMILYDLIESKFQGKITTKNIMCFMDLLAQKQSYKRPFSPKKSLDSIGFQRISTGPKRDIVP